MHSQEENEAAAFKKQLDTVKRSNFGQVLMKCARLYNEQAIELLRQRTGVEGIRLAHTHLFPHLDLEGTRLTHIAERMKMSKQAITPWIRELEALGIIERVPDPTDGRAKLIRFSQKGQQALLLGLDVLDSLRKDIEHELGSSIVSRLQGDLLHLLDTLEQRAIQQEEQKENPLP